MEEADAFDQRIEQRIAAGFVPDLRRLVRCDYFYKSFWRDPHYVRLCLGPVVATYLEFLRRYAKPGASILDVGCGAGYVSLELARSGYHVHGIDISASCIREARRMLDENPYAEGFGALRYDVTDFFQLSDTYDVVLFSGMLHHLADPERAATHTFALVRRGGHIICAEPCHERWEKKDAAQVALIRGLLSLAGVWYSNENRELLRDEIGLQSLTDEIHHEYLTERDRNEPKGQSPNDNSSTGNEILVALRSHFSELETRPGHAFIYRVLGGLRGKDEQIYAIADFLAAYDRLSIAAGYMNPNIFYFVGRKQ